MSCPNDETLSAMMGGKLEPAQVQAVHAHVDTCSRCQTVLSELGHQLSPPSTAPADSSAGPSPLDRYQRKQQLGEGGMGVVYLAHDTVLHRDVALKLLRPDAFGHRESDLAQRFVREARALAAINHPHVVSVHDAGFSPEGGYIVLEHVAGMTFARWSEGHPQRVEVVRLMCEVGEALVTLHRAGLVHRDVKPSNILVTQSASAKLSDFGLVTASSGSTLTQTGAAIGTPAYMAPEQARGKPADARADQYAFCVTLLEALAGERVSGPRATLRLATEARSGKGLPLGLWKILERGTQGDPTRRYASMEELLSALRRFALPQAWKGPGCGRSMLIIMVVLGVLATLGLGSFAVGRFTAPVPEQVSNPQKAVPRLPEPMRGAWYKEGATLGVTAEGIHADTNTVLSDGKVLRQHDTLRVTHGHAASTSRYRVTDGDTNQVFGDDDGCAGTLELRGDKLLVTLTGEGICSARLSGTWQRDRPPRVQAPSPSGQ